MISSSLARDGAETEIRVETVSGCQAFLDLENDWNRLVQETEAGHPFLEHAWMRTWWECFGGGSTLHVLVAKAGGETIGIAPLVLTPARMWGLRVRRLGFFYNAHVPRADFIIPRRRSEVYGALWRHISRDRSWDVVQLCQLRKGSETLEALPRLAAEENYLVGQWKSGEAPFVPCRGGWEEYFQQLPAKHRSNLRNRLKRLQQLGRPELETITSGEDLERHLEAGFRLEASGWKAKARTAILSSPDLPRFYAALARRAAARGWLLLHFLRAGEKRIAFEYCLLYHNWIHCLKGGYDPAYSPYSPYNLLIQSVLRSAFEGGRGGYDFLGSAEPWKLQWTRRTEPYYWIFIFRRQGAGTLLHAVKFRLLPFLQRRRLYRALRDRMAQLP
jgi:CelD/BcsL family acetyltransferase involved in cellulose biosynthesis